VLESATENSLSN